MNINVSRETLPGGEDVDLIAVPVRHPNRNKILEDIAAAIDNHIYAPANHLWQGGDDAARDEMDAARVAIDRLRKGNPK